MDSVQCTVYTIHYTLYIVHCTLYTVHFTLYTVHCAVDIVTLGTGAMGCDGLKYHPEGEHGRWYNTHTVQQNCKKCFPQAPWKKNQL